MRKLFKKIIALSILPLLLSSCGKKDVSIDKYFLDIEVGNKLSSGYRILQLSDLHFSMGTNLNEDQKYLNKLMYQAKPDYIVITGDTFMDATLHEVEFVYSYFDSLNIPWSIVWGNHDKYGQYHINDIISLLKQYKNVKFIDYYYDNVYGNSNYAINIKNNGETKWRLVMLDSNSYYNNIGSFEYTYDVIHEDQIRWYEEIINYENNINIPSLVFMHIPTPEFLEAFNPDNEYNGEKNEGVNYGYKNSGFFKTCKKLNSTKGIFVGHDHNNNYAVNYDGIVLSYGVKTGINCYHNDKIGGQVITISDNQNFTINSIERIYVDYAS